MTDGAKGAGTGAVVGVLYGRPGQGALAGGVAGAAGSAIVALIRKGTPLVLEPGTLFEIVLDRPIEH